MGVEAGPSGAVGAGVSVAAGAASVRFAFEAAPVVGIPSIVNEGPVRGSLEGFRPMNITDTKPADKGGIVAPQGEIVFNAPNSVPQQDGEGLDAPVWEIAETVSNNQLVESANQEGVAVPIELQVEEIAAAAWKNENIVLSELAVDQDTTTDLHVAIQPDLNTKLAARLQPEVRRVLKQSASPSAGPQTEAVYAPVLQEQLVEEIVEEKVTDATRVANAAEEPSEFREEQETQELRLKYVEDELVSSQRKYELEEAIKRAGAEAEEEGIDEIDGPRIKKFFAPEHAGNRSGIAEDGIPDGSLLETYQEVSAGNYESVTEAVEKAEATVDDKKPVTRATEGKVVKEIDIARVRQDPLLKSHPTEVVVTRIIKKRQLAKEAGQRIVYEEVKPETREPTLEEIDREVAEALVPQAA